MNIVRAPFWDIVQPEAAAAAIVLSYVLWCRYNRDDVGCERVRIIKDTMCP